MGHADVPWWGWVLFAGAVAFLLGLDLWNHRGAKSESHRAAAVWAVIWISAGLSFTFFIWYQMGGVAAQEYLAAYLIEESLSLDNRFVFLIIFQTMRIPKEHQHKALFWGILGAVVFRAAFIFAGAAALERWQWVEYIFAGILLLAAFHAFREKPNPNEESGAVLWLSRHLPMSRDFRISKFFVREDGRLRVTPLFVAVCALEATDVMFAIDSVPAAFSVTRDVFIVYSSNIFAILGLRALYIVLARLIAELDYLHYGLAAVLAFAAGKMIAHKWVTISPLLSVAIIIVLIGSAVAASVFLAKPEEKERLRGAVAGADNGQGDPMQDDGPAPPSSMP